jgi:hypothetical protein
MIMRTLTKVELEKVTGGRIALQHPGANGLSNAVNPLNAARKPKGWAGEIIILPPDRT